MKCPKCPKEYQSEKDLERHLKRIHGLSVVVLKQHSEEDKSEFMKKCLDVLDQMEKEKHLGKG